MNRISENFFQESLGTLANEGLRRQLRSQGGPQSRELTVEGRKVLNFCSNNYLGLADDPRLKEAVIENIREEGFGSGASRLVCGNMPAHERLEQAIARFEGTQDCLLFNSGYMANVGIISSVFGRDDIIFSDRLNHASILDGCRLSFARMARFRHNDMGDLERVLRAAVPVD